MPPQSRHHCPDNAERCLLKAVKRRRPRLRLKRSVLTFPRRWEQSFDGGRVQKGAVRFRSPRAAAPRRGRRRRIRTLGGRRRSGSPPDGRRAFRGSAREEPGGGGVAVVVTRRNAARTGTCPRPGCEGRSPSASSSPAAADPELALTAPPYLCPGRHRGRRRVRHSPGHPSWQAACPQESSACVSCRSLRGLWRASSPRAGGPWAARPSWRWWRGTGS